MRHNISQPRCLRDPKHIFVRNKRRLMFAPATCIICIQIKQNFNVILVFCVQKMVKVFIQQKNLFQTGFSNIPITPEVALLRMKKLQELVIMWVQSVIEIFKAFPVFLKSHIPEDVKQLLMNVLPFLKPILNQ